MRTVLMKTAILMIGIQALALAQTSVEAVARAGETVEVSIGILHFSIGEKIALEIERTGPCPCMCGDILVKAFEVLNEEKVPVFTDRSYDYPVPVKKWVGRWDLRDPSGNPVPPGRYTAVVETSVGTFRAELELLPPGEHPTGRGYAEASVCGISLAVYRLVEKGDSGETLVLKRGDKLMVVLPGNPTTGYSWEPVEVPGFLKPIEGVEYVPLTDLAGGGDIFCFRYLVEAPGKGTLSFAYRRPWEEEPIETFSVELKTYGF